MPTYSNRGTVKKRAERPHQRTDPMDIYRQNLQIQALQESALADSVRAARGPDTEDPVTLRQRMQRKQPVNQLGEKVMGFMRRRRSPFDWLPRKKPTPPTMSGNQMIGIKKYRGVT